MLQTVCGPAVRGCTVSDSDEGILAASDELRCQIELQCTVEKKRRAGLGDTQLMEDQMGRLRENRRGR